MARKKKKPSKAIVAGDPKLVDCPQCGQTIGNECLTIPRWKPTKPHLRRIEALRAQIVINTPRWLKDSVSESFWKSSQERAAKLTYQKAAELFTKNK